MGKMWDGRFKEASAALADEFNRSLNIDIRLFNEDIEGSIAHATMLGECDIIPKNDAEKIVNELAVIREDIISGKLLPDNSEDVHMFIESELTRRLGDIGKKVHTSRSRNDQVATDFRLYVKKGADKLNNKLRRLIETLVEISGNNLKTIMPGFTHLQKAQPITMGHHLMAYVEMFLRDIERTLGAKKRADIMPLGSCALAGTTYPIDRERTADILGFSSISQNSLDGVSDRDFAIEYCFSLSMIAMHLSRFCEELILWSSDDYRYIEIGDAYATGSSIMPQKKNPDMAELIRGKTGRVYGNLISLLTIMKSLPLAYNKDLQEDKAALFDSEDTVFMCLDIFTEMFTSITFNDKRMKQCAMGGFTDATDVADYLAKKGVPFRDAHKICGNIVQYCISKKKTLNLLKIEEFKSFSPLFEEDIKDAIKIENIVKRRDLVGGPSPVSVKNSIKSVQKRLKKLLG